MIEDFPLSAHTHVEKLTEDGTHEVSYRVFEFEPEIMSAQSYAMGGFPGSTYVIVRRGIAQFNTAALAGKIIDSVHLVGSFAYSTPSGADSYTLQAHIGDFGAVPIVPDAATYEGGALAYEQTAASFVTAIDWDLGSVGKLNVNKTGVTTVRLSNTPNDGYPSDPDSGGVVVWSHETDPMVLRVTWHVASQKLPFASVRP